MNLAVVHDSPWPSKGGKNAKIKSSKGEKTQRDAASLEEVR